MTPAPRPAVFLDRDGTLTELVHHSASDEWGPPWVPAELVLKPGAADLIRNARALGYLVFVVTNQPDVAKGKASLADIDAVEHAFLAQLEQAGAPLDAYERCLHHPDAVLAEYRLACACRKPNTGMIDALAARYPIDAARSFMVGDRDSDIRCGRRAGLRTIAVVEPRTARAATAANPDDVAADLGEAFAILKQSAPRLPA